MKGKKLTKAQERKVNRIVALMLQLEKENVSPILLSSNLVFIREYDLGFDNIGKDFKNGNQLIMHNTRYKISDFNP